MKKINLRESLIKMDIDTDCKYDLTSLYESCRLDEKKKQELVKFVNDYDIDATNALLTNEASNQGLMEKVSDDLSDEELKEFNVEDIEDANIQVVESLQAFPGDYVDFGAYGKLYICNDLGDRYWVTDEPEYAGNKNAPGWFIDKDLAKEIIDDEDLDENWTDAYKEFNKIVDKYFPDEERIESEVYQLAQKHYTEKPWQVAYDKWCETLDDSLDESIIDKAISVSPAGLVSKALGEEKQLNESEEDKLIKDDVINWLQDHETAWSDITNYFNTEDLESIELDKILGWISDHDTLYSDFQIFFDITLDEDLNEGVLGDIGKVVKAAGKEIANKTGLTKAYNNSNLKTKVDNVKNKINNSDTMKTLKNTNTFKRIKDAKDVRGVQDNIKAARSPEEIEVVAQQIQALQKDGKLHTNGHMSYLTKQLNDRKKQLGIKDVKKESYNDDFDDYYESLKESNNVSNELPFVIDQFLQDIAQIHGTINYNDIIDLNPTEEDIKTLNKLRTKYNKEAQYNDKDAETNLELIARDVANIVGHKVNESIIDQDCDDDFDDDELANIYGGDRNHCPDCGSSRYYDGHCYNCGDPIDEGYELSPEIDYNPNHLRDDEGKVMADKWYASKWPDDEVGIEQLEGITLDDALKNRKILDHCDTQVRERVYAQLDKYIPLSVDSPMHREKNESKTFDHKTNKLTEKMPSKSDCDIIFDFLSDNFEFNSLEDKSRCVSMILDNHEGESSVVVSEDELNKVVSKCNGKAKNLNESKESQDFANITALADDCGKNTFKVSNRDIRFTFENEDDKTKFVNELLSSNIPHKELTFGIISINKSDALDESKSIKESNQVAYGNEKYKGYMIRQDRKHGCYNIYDKNDEMEDSGFKSIDDAKEYIDSLNKSLNEDDIIEEDYDYKFICPKCGETTGDELETDTYGHKTFRCASCGYDSQNKDEWNPIESEESVNESKSINEAYVTEMDKLGDSADLYSEYDLLNLPTGTRIDLEDIQGRIYRGYVLGQADKTTIYVTFDESNRFDTDADNYQEISISNIVRVYNDDVEYDIDESKSIKESFNEDDIIDYDYDEESQFTEIDSKRVTDIDGFLTDYTMYRDVDTGEYVFVFGDKDIYGPEDGDFDWSCDTEKEAREWFDNYIGFDDDEMINESSMENNIDREDLENAAEYALSEVQETFVEPYYLGGTWFENGKWTVNVQGENFDQYEATISVDMTKIKEPWHLKREYASKMGAELIAQIKKLNKLDEDFEKWPWIKPYRELEKAVMDVYQKAGWTEDMSEEETSKLAAEAAEVVKGLVNKHRDDESWEQAYKKLLDTAPELKLNESQENDLEIDLRNSTNNFTNLKGSIKYESSADADASAEILKKHYSTVRNEEDSTGYHVIYKGKLEESLPSTKTFAQWFDETQRYGDDEEFYPFDNYVKHFPNAEILRNITAKDVINNAHKFYDIYQVDSEDRMKAFIFAGEQLGIDQDIIYKAWLNEEPINKNNII